MECRLSWPFVLLTTLSSEPRLAAITGSSQSFEEGRGVIESAKQREVLRASRAEAFLAADVGGTHARIGLVRVADASSTIDVLRYERYACAEWPSLTAVLQDFVGRLDGQVAIAHCAVASAGYVVGDAIVNENLPWPVSIGDIRQTLGLSGLAVVNDFEAVAYACQFLQRHETAPIIETDAAPAEGPILVMGPGTGLGSAVLLPGRPHATVLPTEAGQISLAPGNAREVAILGELARDRDYVSYETALSGPGLVNLYRAISRLRGSAATLAEPAAVTGAALDGSDIAASEALDVFCGLLGSFVGDLAMLYGARGGVYLAGGILPQVRERLLASSFATRFFNKGVMRAFLQQVPVRLMDHGQLGVIGAAGLYLHGSTAH
ncbi:glucokinase [Luteibacter yeojuensis]|uniref:Glucokinase n=1 Tax=Luteibacter yeojuensis TaxID=345309 RepID=A0A7X5TRM9_9GAMM|nr:glucokinase [Luteibacter yeojuensis]